jgi:nicotinate-nucleotide pyrophosphorylase (carboxylating)
MSPTLPPRLVWEPIVQRALAEDLGEAGDITTDLVVPGTATARADLVLRQGGVISGLEVFAAVLSALDPAVEVKFLAADGDRVPPGTVVAEAAGQTRALLTAERVALNLFGRMCGIATQTAEVVAAVTGTGVRIVDTRKTTPGLRSLEKYAVRCGGGHNHRFGLDDAVLIKDNHIAVAGGISAAVKRVRDGAGHVVAVEVEVETDEQLAEALASGVEVVLLDNMTPDQVAAAVEVTAGRAVLEASGGITAANVADYAKTGVDVISLGWLTHSAPALDVALEISSVG